MGAYFAGALVEEIESIEKWSARSGLILTRRWKGMPDQIELYKSQARALGYDYATDWDLPYLILSVDFPEDSTQPDDTPLSDDWELKRNLIEKDIWLLPKVQAELNKIAIFDDAALAIALLKSDVEKLLAGESTTMKPTFNSDGTVTWEEVDLSLTYIKNQLFLTEPSINWTVISGLIGSLAKGTRSKFIPSPVLVRTLVTNKNSQVKATQTNVGAIFSTQSLIASEGVSSSVKFDLPQGYWMKHSPEVNRIEKAKWEIKQEYWFADDYDRFVYDQEPV